MGTYKQNKLLISIINSYLRFVKLQQDMRCITRLQPGYNLVINDLRKSTNPRGKVVAQLKREGVIEVIVSVDQYIYIYM